MWLPAGENMHSCGAFSQCSQLEALWRIWHDFTSQLFIANLCCYVVCFVYLNSLILLIWAFLREQIKGRYCFSFWFIAELFEVCMLQSSICIWFPFHRVSSHISFIFRILMSEAIVEIGMEIFLHDWVLLCYQAYLYLCKSHQIWHDKGRVHGYVYERGGETWEIGTEGHDGGGGRWGTEAYGSC